VFRSGDVIPTILDVEVDESIEPIFPPLGLKWHWKGKDIVLDDVEGNRTVQIKRLEYFFATIGVPRLREKTLEKLYDSGFKTVKSLTSAKPSDFIKVKGIGKKTSESHFKNIHDTMRKTRIDRFIPASSTLTLGIGRKLIKQLMRYHSTILEEDEATIKKVLTKKKIPGFGPKRIENVAENIPKFRDFLFSLNKDDIKYAIKADEDRRKSIAEKGYNTKIRGKSFVLTGFFGKIDYELEDYIYDNFGNFSSTVVEGTTAVISANLLEVSSKVMTAQTLKVPVLNIEEFVKKFDVPYSKFKKEDEEGEGEAIQLEPDEE
jgi:NAD-dependent DNA ligase